MKHDSNKCKTNEFRRKETSDVSRTKKNVYARRIFVADFFGGRDILCTRRIAGVMSFMCDYGLCTIKSCQILLIDGVTENIPSAFPRTYKKCTSSVSDVCVLFSQFSLTFFNRYTTVNIRAFTWNHPDCSSPCKLLLFAFACLTRNTCRKQTLRANLCRFCILYILDFAI